MNLGENASILFPLMATRSRKGAVLEDRVKPLLNAAIEYFLRNPQGVFRRAYFLTYTDKELDVCQELLAADARLRDYQALSSQVVDLSSDTPFAPACLGKYRRRARRTVRRPP